MASVFDSLSVLFASEKRPKENEFLLRSEWRFNKRNETTDSYVALSNIACWAEKVVLRLWKVTMSCSSTGGELRRRINWRVTQSAVSLQRLMNKVVAAQSVKVTGIFFDDLVAGLKARTQNLCRGL